MIQIYQLTQHRLYLWQTSVYLKKISEISQVLLTYPEMITVHRSLHPWLISFCFLIYIVKLNKYQFNFRQWFMSFISAQHPLVAKLCWVLKLFETICNKALFTQNHVTCLKLTTKHWLHSKDSKRVSKMRPVSKAPIITCKQVQIWLSSMGKLPKT